MKIFKFKKYTSKNSNNQGGVDEGNGFIKGGNGDGGRYAEGKNGKAAETAKVGEKKDEKEEKNLISGEKKDEKEEKNLISGEKKDVAKKHENVDFVNSNKFAQGQSSYEADLAIDHINTEYKHKEREKQRILDAIAAAARSFKKKITGLLSGFYRNVFPQPSREEVAKHHKNELETKHLSRKKAKIVAFMQQLNRLRQTAPKATTKASAGRKSFSVAGAVALNKMATSKIIKNVNVMQNISNSAKQDIMFANVAKTSASSVNVNAVKNAIQSNAANINASANKIMESSVSANVMNVASSSALPLNLQKQSLVDNISNNVSSGMARNSFVAGSAMGLYGAVLRSTMMGLVNVLHNVLPSRPPDNLQTQIVILPIKSVNNLPQSLMNVDNSRQSMNSVPVLRVTISVNEGSKNLEKESPHISQIVSVSNVSSKSQGSGFNL